MRPSLIAGAAAAALVIASCNDGGSDDVEAFCSEYQQVEEELSQLDQSDADAVDAVFDRIDDLDPPDEIEDEFQTVTDFNRTLYAAGQEVDLDDPEAADQLQQEVTERAEELDEVSDKVNDYLLESCGIGATD
jgi:protein subunit release factor A